MGLKKIIIIILVLLMIAGGGAAWYVYREYSKPVVELGDKEWVDIYIPTGSTYDDVRTIFKEQHLLTNEKLFDFLAEKKNYVNKVKAGKYRIKNHMTANELINMLRSGTQVPVRFTFTNIRFVDKLAGLAAKKLELDSAELSSLFHNDQYLEQFGFNHQTVAAMFLPNTYEFYWNTSAEEFMQRMYREYQKFWNSERKQRAQEIGLSPLQVSILASIVQEETNKRDEMARIAGVYINRLNRGMLLQADPTARFAYGDFSVQRVTYDYLKTDSPYNTYIYPGLPPGPICMPEPTTIDKVLHYEKNNYLFFCAKADGSGYHAFARTHSEHIRNANAYHRYLNRQGIR
jgi:UPF0755 protein